MRRRFVQIGSALGLAILAAQVMIWWQSGRIHGALYRWTADEMAFFQVLARGTARGQTRDSFEGLLGRGKTLNATEEAVFVKVLKECEAKRHPDTPDGYRNGDVFVQFRVGAGLLYSFQFRDGRLVNHDPASFATAQPFRLLGR